MSLTTTARAEHRAFLNSYYGLARYFYDVTRKYYLFGRDDENETLLREDWRSLVEVGPGTGRNLCKLHDARPDALFGALEASDEMLAQAARRCPFAQLRLGFAEDADLGFVLDRAPERVLFSYCLSMCQDPAAALDRALDALAPGGEVAVVDFGDFRGLPAPVGEAFRHFLAAYHVRPVDPRLLLARGARVTWGPAGYYFRARLSSGTPPVGA